MRAGFLKFFAVLVCAGGVGCGAIVWAGLRDDIQPADVALVLGNKVEPDGTPSARLQARLDTAVALYRKGYFKKVIVSGGTGREGFPEGTAMRDYLVRQGLPESAILVDNEGVDTRSSARNTATILKAASGRSVLVISQYFHIPRAKLALEQEGVAPVYHAHPSYFESRDVYSILREAPAYGKYLLHGSG